MDQLFGDFQASQPQPPAQEEEMEMEQTNSRDDLERASFPPLTQPSQTSSSAKAESEKPKEPAKPAEEKKEEVKEGKETKASEDSRKRKQPMRATKINPPPKPVASAKPEPVASSSSSSSSSTSSETSGVYGAFEAKAIATLETTLQELKEFFPEVVAPAPDNGMPTTITKMYEAMAEGKEIPATKFPKWGTSAADARATLFALQSLHVRAESLLMSEITRRESLERRPGIRTLQVAMKGLAYALCACGTTKAEAAHQARLFVEMLPMLAPQTVIISDFPKILREFAETVVKMPVTEDEDDTDCEDDEEKEKKKKYKLPQWTRLSAALDAAELLVLRLAAESAKVDKTAEATAWLLAAADLHSSLMTIFSRGCAETKDQKVVDARFNNMLRILTGYNARTGMAASAIKRKEVEELAGAAWRRILHGTGKPAPGVVTVLLYKAAEQDTLETVPKVGIRQAKDETLEADFKATLQQLEAGEDAGLRGLQLEAHMRAGMTHGKGKKKAKKKARKH